MLAIADCCSSLKLAIARLILILQAFRDDPGNLPEWRQMLAVTQRILNGHGVQISEESVVEIFWPRAGRNTTCVRSSNIKYVITRLRTHSHLLIACATREFSRMLCKLLAMKIHRRDRRQLFVRRDNMAAGA